MLRIYKSFGPRSTCSIADCEIPLYKEPGPDEIILATQAHNQPSSIEFIVSILEAEILYNSPLSGLRMKLTVQHTRWVYSFKNRKIYMIDLRYYRIK